MSRGRDRRMELRAMLARSARQASLSVGTSAVRGNVRTENRRKLTASESRPLTRRFTFGVVSCWIAEIPWITGRDRPAPARLLQIAQSCGRSWGRGGYSALSISSNSPFSLPYEQQRSFPAAPSASAVAFFVQPPPRRGSGAPTGALFLSFFLSRVRGATPACERGPVPVRPGPLSALHRSNDTA